jgi:hypothetical protein
LFITRGLCAGGNTYKKNHIFVAPGFVPEINLPNCSFFEHISNPVSTMDDMDEVTWHDDPEDYDNDDDEAENLRSVIEVVDARLVDPEEIKNEVS